MPIEYDQEIVAEVVEDEPLPVDVTDRVLAPIITIDGRIHGPTSDFLRTYCFARPNLASARRLASDLRGWLDYLCNDCGLIPFEDGRDPTLVATEDHFARYYRMRQYGSPEQVLTSEGWARAASAIKRYYEYTRNRYQHAPPFDIVSFNFRGMGSGTMIAKYQPRRRSTGSAGVPITPEFADLLLMGALRVDRDGHQANYRAADRDHAIISLGLGAGLRRNNLANVTTYEIPKPSGLRFTTMRIADRITKNDAGGDALVFTHRLPAVYGYLDGARADIVASKRFEPPRPLQMVSADATGVQFVSEELPDEVISRRWTEMDEGQRRRLVDVDGSSPILFLNEYTGAPLAYSTYQHAVDDAGRFVRERINPDFPDRFRLHDLRHTYAVHLAVAIYRGQIAEAVGEVRQSDWTVDHIAAAVELVKYSLGHASEASTRLYIQAAHRFLEIPAAEFVGGA